MGKVSESILSDLTEQQRDAVIHKDGPLLVLAGAGTGKTRVITRRIAALVETGVRADRILAITFTNKASGEMRDRTLRLVTGTPTITTFHSFGARVLRRHPRLAGLERHFSIFDDSDQISAVKEAAREAKVDLESWPAKSLMSGISDAKNKLFTPIEYEEQAITPKQRAVSAVYPLYQKLLRGRNGVDFDDLLLLPLELLQKEEDVKRLWADWYRYILIDEYQDTNKVQYQLAMTLAKEHRNLCVTGDPDQSIYGWRGADISNILNFERDFPDAKIVPLTKNFRSTQKILDAANRLISFNIRRKEKSLTGVKGEGTDIVLRHFDSTEEEAFYVARRVSELRGSGLSLGDIALLYRANFQSRLLEESLVHRGIPYNVVGAVAFYQRKEIKDLLAYLRVIANKNDDYAALRIINTPTRRIGGTSVERLNTWRRGHSLSLLESAGRVEEVKTIKRGRKNILAWHTLMKDLEKFSETCSVEALLREIVERLSYKEHLEKMHPDEPDRLENVLGLINAAAEFDRDSRMRAIKAASSDSGAPIQENQGPEPGVSGFLEHVSLVSAADDLEDKECERVSLMTVHTAKGLEFDSVFLVGLEEGIFPNSRSMEESWGLEEERRLAYVAITRAKRRLTLSYNRHRTRFGQFEMLDPSQFLHEAGLIEEPRRRKRNRYDEEEFSQVPPDWDEDKQPKSRWRLKPAKAPPRKKTPRWAPSPLDRKGHRSFKSRAVVRARDVKDPFKSGDRVRHEHFGLGDVSSVSGYGPGTRVCVMFDKHGEKTLVLQYARLTKIE